MLLRERQSKIQHLIDINRHVQAKQLTRDGLSEAPSDTNLLYYLSLICLIEENHEEGVLAANSGLAIAPDDEDLRYMLFKHLEALREFADAELLIIELIQHNPRESTYLADYAQLMLYSFNGNKARELVNEALRIAPNNKSALLIEALIDITQGQLKEAELTLQALIKDDPQSEQVLHFLLIQLVEKKRNRAALVLAQELLRSNPLDKELVDLIIELRTATHWSAMPLWPLQQLGLVGTFLLWASFIVLIIINRFIEWPHFIFVVYAYLGYCLFSWIHEPIVKRIIKWQGA